MTTKKAVQITAYGDIDQVTQLISSEVAEPAADQVVVALLAAPIHPANVLLIKGLYPARVNFPETMGNEGIGKVLTCGSEVDNLKVGQVVLLPPGTATWQSHFILPAKQLIPVPVEDEETILQLAMVGVNPPTAYLMLHNFVELKEGDWIIQNAANSAVGRYVIQLAKQMGVKTINIVRREELVEELTALGADAVVVDNEKLSQQVKEIVGEGKVVLGIDAVAGDASDRMARCLIRGGTLLVYGSMSLRPVEVEVGTMLVKDVIIKSFWLSAWYQTTNPKDVFPLLQKLSGMIMQGQLKTKIAKTFSLDEYKEALRYADTEAKGGKVLFTS